MAYKKIGFLPDIDGLRAVAVLAVVLFHLKVTGFDGGYVGVDIFFVISGFLITGLIQERYQEQHFSFSQFYANRVRRLLPAIIATVAATSVAALFVLQPQMLEAYAQSAAATVFSVANIVFYMEAGYWDANAELKPLLHMWSLGVEEQFYLLWPAFLIVLLRGGAWLYRLGLVVAFALSLGFCIQFTATDSAAAFYLLPFRVWQFCLGAMALELWRQFTPSLFTQQWLRSLGLALCGYAILTFNADTPFPGVYALVPSLGAALVLLSTHHAEPSPWLANRPMIWVGKLSYSIYLVHWSPIALYRCYTLSELTPVVQLALGALTLVLALALHYGVELRFYQRHSKSASWRGAPAYSLLIAAAFAAVMLYVQSTPDSWAQREAGLNAESNPQWLQDLATTGD